MQHCIIGLIFFVFAIWAPLSAQAGLLFSVDYEDGTFGNVGRTSSSQPSATGYPSLCCTHSAQVVTSPVRAGGKAVKVTLLPTDAGYEYGRYKDPYVRAEFEKWNVAHVGDTRWYGFSVYVDPSYTDASTDPNGTIVFQWHTNKDSCDVTKGPHLSINITRTLEWRVRAQSDTNPCTTDPATSRIDWNLGSVSKGSWVDFVVYAKWSYGSDGVLRIWKDGKLLIERYGANAYNDQTMEFVKWGVYKSWWAVQAPPAADRLIVYLDQIKVGDADSSYTDVAPGSSSTVVNNPNTPTDLRIIGN